MRQLFSLSARGVLAVVVVVVLAAPVQAASVEIPELRWAGRTRDRIVQIMKNVKKTIRSFGDGLIDPRP